VFRRGEYAFGTAFITRQQATGQVPRPVRPDAAVAHRRAAEFASIGSPCGIVRLPGYEFPSKRRAKRMLRS
jgi:hypothetical protein